MGMGFQFEQHRLGLWAGIWKKNNFMGNGIRTPPFTTLWNGLIIRLQAPKSFDACPGSLSQALEIIAGNPRIRPVWNSLDHTLCLELKWDRHQRKKSFHSNVSSRRDQGCSHSLSRDLPPTSKIWNTWNTNMATQNSRQICDVMWKRSINPRKYGLSEKLDSRFHRSISENIKAWLSNVPWARVGNFWQSESIKSLSFWKGLRRSRRHFDRHRM